MPRCAKVGRTTNSSLCLRLFAVKNQSQTIANVTMPKTAAIGVRVEPEVKEAAERAAADDHRPVASLLEKLLIEYLTANGYLPAAKPPRSSTKT